MNAQQAREFFLYQDSEDVTDAYVRLTETDPDTVDLRIDWGIDDRGHIYGGDIIIGPRYGGVALEDDQLVALAETMGGDAWDRPAWEPTWRVA